MVKIYTKVGDKGQTRQYSGKMVYKDDRQIEALGALDELQSYLGVARAGLTPAGQQVQGTLADLQRKLYLLQADIGVAQHNVIVMADVTALETEIDAIFAQVPRLKGFILPGGQAAGAALQFARTLCRRAERYAVALNRDVQPLDPAILAYLNRLSDYLFALALYVNWLEGYTEELSKL